MSSLSHNLSKTSPLVIASISVRQDAEGNFCLNDLHKAAGSEQKHRPKYWLANQQTKELINEISIGGITPINTKQGLGTFACKELVYSYAMWISSKFCLHVIRAYDALVSNPELLQITAERITKEQAGILYNTVKERTGENGSLRAKMWGVLKSHYKYASYHDLLAIHFDDAKQILETMELKEIPQPSAFNILPEGRFLVINKGGNITTRDVSGHNLIDAKVVQKLMRDLRAVNIANQELWKRMAIFTGDQSQSLLDNPISI